jgi:hypothetical protein
MTQREKKIFLFSFAFIICDTLKYLHKGREKDKNNGKEKEG